MKKVFHLSQVSFWIAALFAASLIADAVYTDVRRYQSWVVYSDDREGAAFAYLRQCKSKEKPKRLCTEVQEQKMPLVTEYEPGLRRAGASDLQIEEILLALLETSPETDLSKHSMAKLIFEPFKQRATTTTATASGGNSGSPKAQTARVPIQCSSGTSREYGYKGQEEELTRIIQRRNLEYNRFIQTFSPNATQLYRHSVIAVSCKPLNLEPGCWVKPEVIQWVKDTFLSNGTFRRAPEDVMGSSPASQCMDHFRGHSDTGMSTACFALLGDVSHGQIDERVTMGFRMGNGPNPSVSFCGLLTDLTNGRSLCLTPANFDRTFLYNRCP